MEKFEGVNKCESTAIESDWLDVSYTQRNYINDEKKYVDGKSHVKHRKVPAFVKYVAMAVAVCAIVLGMIFVDVSKEGNIFATAKQVFITSVFNSEPVSVMSETVVLPATAVVDNVASDGTVTICGGKIVASLMGGKVINVTESTVTIESADNVKMIYSSLNDVLVEVGAEVLQYQAIGRYTDKLTVNVLYNDEIVTNVTGSEYSFKWSV